MKNTGYIVANPAEFLIHQRFGKTRSKGRDISFLCLPLIDRVYRIPSSTHSLGFAADQITAENQGIEVSGFAIWKVADPETACRNFDFEDAERAMRTIGANLKDVVESAIRHQVANMTIEDALRKRGSIILRLKEELAYIAGQWGLAIETVEIKNVQISSVALFENMQARFRDAVRLASEESRLDTEREIAHRKLAHAQELAQIEHENRERTLRLDQRTNVIAAETQKAGRALERDNQEHMAAIARIRDGAERARIETANLASPALALIDKLPAAANALSINELNLGDNALRQIAGGLLALMGKETK